MQNKQQKPSTEVTVHQSAIAKLNHPDMVKALRAVLPTNVTVESYLAVAAAEIKGPNLKKVQDVSSILLSVFHAAKLGLSLNTHMGEAYLVPYNCKQPDGNYKVVAQFIPGYQGLAKLIRQADVNGISVIDIKGFCVHDNDHFEYSINGDEGLTVSYKPNLIEKPGRRIAAFSMAKFSNGFVSYHVVPGYKIEEIREKALKKTKGYGPWKDNEDEMWVKTPIRHHAKFLPKSEKLSSAIAQDEIFEGKPLSSNIPDELMGTGVIDEVDYVEIIDGANTSENDKSKKPETDVPLSKSEKAKSSAEPVKALTPKEVFLDTLRSIALNKGAASDIDSICMAEFSFTSDEIPAKDYREVLEHFKNL